MGQHLTPEEVEIVRLWGVIKRLRERVMNGTEEALFGLVYQEFKNPTTRPADADPDSVAEARADMIRVMGGCMRKLAEMEKR